jgi:glycosyltransferase involved in cell wall biosynthesis
VCRAYPPAWLYANGSSLRWVARHARALDALTPVLAEEVSSRLERRCAVVLPAMPLPVRNQTPNPSLELQDLSRRAATAVFTGSILPVYLDDVILAMRAVADVRARGHALTFVHAGAIHPRLDAGRLARSAGLGPDAARFLGYLPFASIPSLLAHATVLLQPGKPSDFNRLRLPAKLQAYLASGTPTITFAVGVGELLEDRLEVLKTYGEQPSELADRIVELLDDAELRATLSRSGPQAAARLFDPETNTEALLDHYRGALRQ